MFLGCVGYLCCCMDEQYDDIDFDSSSVLHSDRVPIISDEPRCLGSSSEVGEDESVRRRYALHLPKRPARQATEMGPVISKEEVETRLAAYHDWKKSNQIN
ncbi:hypothetical protein D915_009764 [Fasciola hepatica]|uniref:Uncharacterized protein n=1 Tax=Fasciola hepatica TaxID=6192 RepID=A0A4E0QX19_FASHE|nr:hypothetical protein D915_009764 [Fasciola hepatica]